MLSLLFSSKLSFGLELELVNEFLEGQEVTDICEWKGKVWASTNKGLFRFEENEAVQVAVAVNENDKITSLFSGSPYALVCGTFQGDLLFITQDKSNYCQAVWSMKDYIKNTSFYVNCVSQNEAGIWLGTLEKGILLYNPETDSLQQFSLDFNDDTIGLNVYEFNTMKDGKTWALAQNGLYFVMNVFGEKNELQYIKSKKISGKPIDLQLKKEEAFIASRSGNKSYLASTKFGKNAFDIRLKRKTPIGLEKIKAIEVNNLNDYWVLNDRLTHKTNNSSVEYYLKPSSNLGINTTDMVFLNDLIYVSTAENGVLVFNKNQKAVPEEIIPNIASFSNAKVELDKKLELDLVFFAPGDSLLKESSHKQLQHLINILESDNSINVELTGHTAYDANTVFLKQLSLGRANSVKRYLLDNNIAETRIITSGKGADELKVPQKPKSPQNRRVEILLRQP